LKWFELTTIENKYKTNKRSGGAGGGCIKLSAPIISIDEQSRLCTNGENARLAGGGGGSGGTIVIDCHQLNILNLNATGNQMISVNSKNNKHKSKNESQIFTSVGGRGRSLDLNNGRYKDLLIGEGGNGSQGQIVIYHRLLNVNQKKIEGRASVRQLLASISNPKPFSKLS
jgi:hypothetical protein